MAIIQRLPGTLTGPNVSGLPFYSDAPALGVPGYGYRYRAESITAAAETTVTSWPTIAGANALTVPSGRTAPTLKASGSRRFVKFDGVNNVLQNAALSMTGQRTIVAVARVADTTLATGHDILSIASSTDIGLQKIAANNTYSAFLPGTASRSFSDGAGGIGIWRFFAITFTATEGILYVDGNASAAVTTGLTSDMLTSLRLAYLNQPAPGNVEIAEVVTWPTALTSTEIATVRTNLRIAQAGLLP